MVKFDHIPYISLFIETLHFGQVNFFFFTYDNINGRSVNLLTASSASCSETIFFF